MVSDALFKSEVFAAARPSAKSEFSTPALLALKRFARGRLRQASLGLLSLFLAINFSVHLLAVEEPPMAEEVIPSVPAPSITALETISEAVAPEARLSSAEAVRPHRLLHAKMTHHHLTSARMTMPPVIPSAQSDNGYVTIAH